MSTKRTAKLSAKNHSKACLHSIAQRCEKRQGFLRLLKSPFNELGCR